MVIEINLKKRKWLLLDICNPRKDMTTTFLRSIGLKLDELYLKYENIIILGDFNSEMCEEVMQIYCITYDFKCFVKEATCYKSIISHGCIDLGLWSRGLIFTEAIGVRIPVAAVKFHNVYDYTIVQHPWQVSENHKLRVHPSHVREIG